MASNAFSQAYLDAVHRQDEPDLGGHALRSSYILALLVWLAGPEVQEEVGRILGHLASEDGDGMREELDLLGTRIKRAQEG